MNGVYILRDIITTVTTAKLLLWVQCPSDAVLRILSARITSENENTSERLVASLAKATGTVGGGDALTPEPDGGQAAFGGTAKGGNTAITGMTVEADDKAFAYHGEEKLAGWEWTPLPEERRTLSPSEQLVLQTNEALANATDLICEIRFEEIGG